MFQHTEWAKGYIRQLQRSRDGHLFKRGTSEKYAILPSRSIDAQIFFSAGEVSVCGSDAS
jgi:hypothetical protein